MATQGLLSIIEDGQVICKLVCGCNGYNIQLLVEELRKSNVSAEDVYNLAKELDVGCDSCLIVMSKKDSSYNTNYSKECIDCVPESYFEMYNHPHFNPRWKNGTAGFSIVINVSELVEE